MAAQARFADVAVFRAAVPGHVGPFKVWHQERRIGQLLEQLFTQMRQGALPIQASLALDSPPGSKNP
ncbi:MAG: hypothetical protein ACYDBQ_10255 [Thermoplasmatota archaeon]